MFNMISQSRSEIDVLNIKVRIRRKRRYSFPSSKEKTKGVPTANTVSDSSAIHSSQSHEGVSETSQTSSSVQSSIDRRFTDSPYSGSCLQKSHEFNDHTNSEVVNTQKDDAVASGNIDLMHSKKDNEKTTHEVFPLEEQKNIETVDSISRENITVHSPQNVQNPLHTDNLPQTDETLNLPLQQSDTKFVSSNLASESLTNDPLSLSVTKHSPTVLAAAADDASKSELHLSQTVNPDTLLHMTSENEAISSPNTHLVEPKHDKVSEIPADSTDMMNGAITAEKSDPLSVNAKTADVNDKSRLDVSDNDLNKAKVNSPIDKDTAVKSLTDLIESLDNIDVCKKYREQKGSNFNSGENETMEFLEKDIKTDQFMSSSGGGSVVDYQAGELRSRIAVSPSNNNPSLSQYTSIYSMNRRRTSLVPHDAATVCAVGIAIVLFVVVVRRLAIMFQES